MWMSVYNLESQTYFKMDICRSLCHSFNFISMRFAVKIKIFRTKFYRKIYFHGKFITEFCYLFFTLAYVFVDE